MRLDSAATLVALALCAKAALSGNLPTPTSPADGTAVSVHTAVQDDFLRRSMSDRRACLEDSSYFAGLRPSVAGPWNSTSSNGHTANAASAYPKPVTLSWTGTGPFAVTVRRATDDRTVFSAEGLSANSVDVYNLEINRSYRWTVANGDGVSTAAAFKTEDVYPRLLWDRDPKGMIFGIRDIGGAVGLDGRRVRQGVIFRSSELSGCDGSGCSQGASFVSDANRGFWLDELGVRFELDLRDANQAGIAKSPLGTGVGYAQISGSDYGNIFDVFDWQGKISENSDTNLVKKALRTVIGCVQDASKHPVVIHCQLGKDRTGTLAFILEALLGVSEDDARRDWEASFFWYHKNRTSLDAVVNGLANYNGSTLAERTCSYVKSIGITEAEIDSLREVMLEPAGEESRPSEDAPVAVDPTEYGDADTGAVTYTWKPGVSGPWEYTTNWTASVSPCHGIPDGAKATALIPAGTSAGTVVSVAKSTVNLKKLDVQNVQPLTMRFDGGRIALAAASANNEADVVFGKTGPATLVFEGAKPQLKITSGYNRGRLYFGETYETTLRFVMPTSPWTAADAPIRSTGEGANINFYSHAKFEIDARAMAVPEEGRAVTNVLAAVGEGGGLRDWSLDEYLAAARIDVPDGVTGVLTNLNNKQVLFILTKRPEAPPGPQPEPEQWAEVPAGFTVSNTVICLGDSLTHGDYADALTIPATPNYFDGRMDGVTDSDNYPFRLARSIPTNYNVIAQSKGGKTTDAILSWIGGIPVKTTYKFTLPAAADELVQIPTNLLYNGTDGGWQHEKRKGDSDYTCQYYGLLTPYLPLCEPVVAGKWDNLTGWLGGVHVRLGGNHATYRTICRTEPGEPVEIPVGATFVPDAMLTYRDAIKVFFAGTNDGKERADTFLQQIADAVERTGTTRYIVISSHSMYGTSLTATTESAYEAKFRAKFGDRHLNLRLAMVERGVATAKALGFTSVTQWNNQGSTGLLCSNDQTHYNTAGYAVLAQFVKEKLQSFGYLPADPEPEPDRCDYLQTDGRGWLDLGFKPHLRNTRIEVVATADPDTASANAMAWAHSDTAAATFYRIGYAFWPSDGHFSYYVSTGDDKERGWKCPLDVPVDRPGIHTVLFGGTDFVVDGVRAAVAELPDDQQAGDTLQLFVSRPDNYQNSPSLKLYSVKVWEANGAEANLVHHFVPVRVGTGATLCDLLDPSLTPLAVQGTGASFTGGDDTAVDAPTCETTFAYDGAAKRPLADTDDYTVLGDVEATLPGTYRLRVVPNGGRCWADDGSHDVRVVEWTITGSWNPVETAFGVSNTITIASQDYCILSFTNTASAGWSWTVPTGVSEFEFLVVAGGGGGGAGQANHADYCRKGGGGGAGGVVTGLVANASGTFTVKVGAGGATGGTLGANGEKGGDSSLTLGDENYVTARGGGYGGGARYASTSNTGNAGGPGGSGGGGSSRNGNNIRAGGASEAAIIGSGVTASASFGNAGGQGYGKAYAGGGGGAGGAGVGASASQAADGKGGAGVTFAISGMPATYACGGGTARQGSAGDGASAAMATGNGGAGGHGNSSGKGFYGEAGGSGIVIIRYAVASEPMEDVIRRMVDAAKSGGAVLPSGIAAESVEIAADGRSFLWEGKPFSKPHYAFARDGETVVVRIDPAEATITGVDSDGEDGAFVVTTIPQTVVGFAYSVSHADDLQTQSEDWERTEPIAGTGGPLELKAPKYGPRRFYRLNVEDR